MKPKRWFGAIVLFTVLTMLIVYVVPGDSPFFILRYVFGFIFVAILPGYCLFSLLFAKENKLDLIEEAVLSVALSFGITGLTGLFLGLSPIGINFTSITISLSIIVVILAFLAFVRKRKLRQLHVQSPEQVST
jgi:uncharacterized membrane protein